MDKIPSFTVDHLILLPGIYISRVDGDITTYDMRTRRPNYDPLMDAATIHSFEHLFATFVRFFTPLKNSVIFFGPMGCQTGFYLLVRNACHQQVLDAVPVSYTHLCLPNGSPRCPECPLEGFCLANAQGSTLQYPVRRAKQNRRVEKRTVFILLAEEQVLLVKRPSKGLLAGMWEFPCIDGDLDVAMAREYLKTVGIPATTLHRLPTAAHVFTHLQWQFQGYQVSLPQIVPVTWSSAKWVRQEELATSYAIPSAYKAYLPYARNARENLTK